jgi:hypothetical protein
MKAAQKLMVATWLFTGASLCAEEAEKEWSYVLADGRLITEFQPECVNSPRDLQFALDAAQSITVRIGDSIEIIFDGRGEINLLAERLKQLQIPDQRLAPLVSFTFVPSPFYHGSFMPYRVLRLPIECLTPGLQGMFLERLTEATKIVLTPTMRTVEHEPCAAQ